MRINVTKSFLPPKEEYENILDRIWASNVLTNNGPLLLELEEKLKARLNDNKICFVSNGTIAIQLGIKALEIVGEVITTPYSYCATTTSLLYENITPVFVDVNENDFNINPNLIESKITENTRAILATHVYGWPCDVDHIESIAKKYNLFVIYDAAHAFNVNYKKKSLLTYGDISTCSFHATKIFHTIEGGLTYCKNYGVHEKIKLLRSFGHYYDDYILPGINGKNSEFHAAMGLCNLNHLSSIIENRKIISEVYDNCLDWSKVQKPMSALNDVEYNFSYYPIVFQTTKKMAEVMEALNNDDIFPRRYFFPSLNKLPYLSNSVDCVISESISSRVLALPLYHDLEIESVHKICRIINKQI